MKNKFYIIAALTLAYSYLFYQHDSGINFLIFNVLLITGLYINKPSCLKSRNCNIAAVGSLISAINLAWLHSDLAIAINLLSLFVLAGFSLNPQASFVVAFANSAYSVFVSVGKKILDHVKIENQTTSKKRSLSLGNFLSYTVPVIIFVIFLSLYTTGNPIFEASISHFLGSSFDMISFGWVFFTVGGFWLIFSFFYQTQLTKLVYFDNNTSDPLSRKRQRKTQSFNPLFLKYEHKAGWISLGLLNLLILLFNLIDAIYLMSGKLPDGLSYSAFVHQGVNTLILSILLAITLVMYFFRGNLNFFKNNQHLKLMAYVWILQNIVLLMATAYKNGIYIAEYGLTYKRIGVYFYLLLALAGLLTTYVKVYTIKTNWYLVRKNAWIFYTAVLVATFFNWSGIVTSYNLNKFQGEKLDTQYLISLPATNLGQLFGALQDASVQLSKADQEKIIDKMKVFIKKHESQDWQSWNFIESSIYQTINQ